MPTAVILLKALLIDFVTKYQVGVDEII